MDQQPTQQISREEELKMLMEIYENTRKTKNYMKWQLIITVALVVLPLLAAMFVVPMALKSMTDVYGSTGILMQQ